MILVLADIDTGVVLLPARDWSYELDESAEELLPRLQNFFDLMMELWLGIPSQDYKD